MAFHRSKEDDGDFLMNSKEYWEARFNRDWEEKGGREQTRFFARLTIENLSPSICSDIKYNGMTIVDWGCAEGDAVNLLSTYFEKSEVTGIDISEAAIERAKKYYPRNVFYAKALKEINRKYDVLFSSNTLEHFENPSEVLRELIKHTQKYLILLLPFQEYQRIEEHVSSFDYSSFPLKVENFNLLYFKEVDCRNLEGSYWVGKQFLIVYSNVEYINPEDINISSIGNFVEHIANITAELQTLQTQLSGIFASRRYKLANRLATAYLWLKHPKAVNYLSDTMVFKYPRKFFLIWKREGLRIALRKARRKLGIDRLFRIHSRQEDTELKKILSEYNHNNPKGIIIYCPAIDWNVPLFQRPHHLAQQLARLGYLYFFCTFNTYDKVKGFHRQEKNLFVTDRFDLLRKNVANAWFIMHAAAPSITIKDINSYKQNGWRLIYDYVDAIHPDILGNAQTIIKRHSNLNSSQVELVLAVSRPLYDEMLKKFPKDKVLLHPNGVDYSHFHINREISNCPEDMKSLVEQGRPIIGYYGALARWIDYDLLNHLTKSRPDWNIVLIGWNYDNSLQELVNLKNLIYLGVKEYEELPRYAIWFDVAIIPFKSGEIARATSPIKLYEYMAMNKPIVVTRDMTESLRYEGVLVGNSKEDFVQKVHDALGLKNDSLYLSLLDRQARENTWEARAIEIDSRLKTCESSRLNEVQNEVSGYCQRDFGQDNYYDKAYRDSEKFYWYPVLKWIDDMGEVKSILDVGAGYGTLLLYAAKIHNPAELAAVDPCNYMPPGLVDSYHVRLVKGDFERECIFEGEHFDLIIFTEVLEHLNFQPVPTLKKLDSLLTPTGKIILSTPDVKEWGKQTKYYRNLNQIPVYDGQKKEWIDDHIWHYSQEEIEQICEQSGLEIETWTFSRGVVGRHICCLLSKKKVEMVPAD